MTSMSRRDASSSRSSIMTLLRSAATPSTPGCSASLGGRPLKRGWRRHPTTSPHVACWESCQTRMVDSPSSFAAASREVFPSHVDRIAVAVLCARLRCSSLAAAQSALIGSGIAFGT
jgi:hypothetical protein